MTEEIRYIANLQRQEEFDNEVTELKDELKRLEQENKELKEQAQLDGECIDKLIEARDMYAKALEEIKSICSNQDLYRGRQALATKLLQLITEVLK